MRLLAFTGKNPAVLVLFQCEIQHPVLCNDWWYGIMFDLAVCVMLNADRFVGRCLFCAFRIEQSNLTFAVG